MRENAKPDAINEATAKLTQEEKRRIAEQAVKVDQRSSYTVDDGDPDKRPYVKAISAADLYDQELPPVEWLLEDILPVGAVAMLSSKPKMFKSYMALGMCVAICQGKPYLGYKSKKCDCLYFDLESEWRRPKERLKQIMHGKRPPRELYLITRKELPKLPKLHEDFEPLLARQLDIHKDVGFVVIDVFTKIRKKKRQSDDSYDRDYEDIDALTRIATEYNITILLIHHNTKGKHDDPFDNAIGSAGIMGALDVAWSIDRERGKQDAYLNIAGRDLEEQQLTMYFDKGDMMWQRCISSDERLAQLERKAYERTNIRQTIEALTRWSVTWQGKPRDFINASYKTNTAIADDAKQLGMDLKKYEHLLREDGFTFEKISKEYKFTNKNHSNKEES